MFTDTIKKHSQGAQDAYRYLQFDPDMRRMFYQHYIRLKQSHEDLGGISSGYTRLINEWTEDQSEIKNYINEHNYNIGSYLSEICKNANETSFMAQINPNENLPTKEAEEWMKRTHEYHSIREIGSELCLSHSLSCTATLLKNVIMRNDSKIELKVKLTKWYSEFLESGKKGRRRFSDSLILDFHRLEGITSEDSEKNYYTQIAGKDPRFLCLDGGEDDNVGDEGNGKESEYEEEEDYHEYGQDTTGETKFGDDSPLQSRLQINKNGKRVQFSDITTTRYIHSQ